MSQKANEAASRQPNSGTTHEPVMSSCSGSAGSSATATPVRRLSSLRRHATAVRFHSASTPPLPTSLSSWSGQYGGLSSNVGITASGSSSSSSSATSSSSSSSDRNVVPGQPAGKRRFIPHITSKPRERKVNIDELLPGPLRSLLQPKKPKSTKKARRSRSAGPRRRRSFKVSYMPPLPRSSSIPSSSSSPMHLPAPRRQRAKIESKPIVPDVDEDVVMHEQPQLEPSAPVRLPYALDDVEPIKTVLTKGALSQGKLLLVQLPCPLPLTAAMRKKKASKAAGSSRLRAGRKVHVDPKEEYIVPTELYRSKVVDMYDDSAPGALKTLPGGFLGKLTITKSGKMQLHLGDIALDVSQGVESRDDQEVVSIDSQTQQMHRLGPLKHKLICEIAPP